MTPAGDAILDSEDLSPRMMITKNTERSPKASLGSLAFSSQVQTPKAKTKEKVNDKTKI